jgi:hypothetical protein
LNNFLNPNSFESNIKIIRELGHALGIVGKPTMSRIS